MYNLSNHTIQVNGWIILSKELGYTSDTLDKLHFEVDLIEKSIVNGAVKPDIVLTSTENDYSIIVDCKSKTIDPDQTERYKQLEDSAEELLQATQYKDEISQDSYEIETSYSSFSDLSGSLIFSTYNIAFVHFERTSSGVFIKNPHQFENQQVAKTFPVNMRPDQEFPTEYYPFDIEQDEDYEEFVSFLIQALISHAAKDETVEVEDTLKWAHPYWESIGDQKQEQFLEEARKVMSKLESEELSEYLENIADSESEYVVHHKTARAIQDRIADPKFISKVAQEVHQATLN